MRRRCLPSSVVITTSFAAGVMSEAVSPYASFELPVLPSGIDINATGGGSSSMTTFPRDGWMGVETHLFVDSIDGVDERYLDGKMEISSGMMDTTIADDMAAAESGIHDAEPGQVPLQVYVDDAAVARAAFRAIRHNQRHECRL